MPGRLAKIFFMSRKFYKDITRKPPFFEIADDVHSPTLGEYYFIMTEEQMLSGHSQQYHFDEKGIPIIPSYIDVEEQKMVYYPISIGQYGLAIWNTYLRTKSEEDKQRFLNIAEWFYHNQIEDEKLGAYWLTHVDKPAYQIFAPWKSCFSQARAINIFVRAFQITGDEDYKQIAEKALKPYLFSVEEGGVVTFLDEGPFYEEYPAKVPVLVLNGMIFALFGIYDFVRVYPKHREAKEIFDKGLDCLEKLLPKFDLGSWSQYSLCKADFHPEIDPATISYHLLHIVQLQAMYKITGHEIFDEFARRWQDYLKLSNKLKMYRIKYIALKKMKRL
jgi:heparosan-N-sulfate-glucuronate 5-epimerase